MKANVDNCRIVPLESHSNGRNGNLSVIQNQTGNLFDIKRVYYLYDVPAGESRGGHAHRQLHELLVAACGSFSVTVTDGVNSKTFNMNRPNLGLYLPPGIWRTLDDFSSGAICLVLSSDTYQEDDYIREYDDFLTFNGI